ncbi:MAG: hypothetical protein QOG51_415 [Verrucomicrobiota bacterium]|jgi:hypothetical protein
MKRFLTTLTSLFLFLGVTTLPTAQGRTLTDIKVIPTAVLQRSISPKFYKSLLVSPVEGWIVARGHLSGTRLTGAKVIRSELKGLYDPLALQLAKEVVIAGNYTLDRPYSGDNVLVHLLVYQIVDATMVLSFAHIDGSGGNQMAYYGCARLLILKDNKWTEIQGPESLAGKGLAVRQGIKNDLATSLKLEGVPKGAESTNMNTGGGGHE